MTKEHRFLLIVFKTTKYFVEGDERSRTNPGHGYPAHTDEIDATEIYAFENQQELELELIRLFDEDKKRKDLLVINVASIIPIKVTLGIQFN
ncbi:MAG: hypothetical protein WA052_02075 [Microgenomates group bacterium]